jgi:urease accessory protein
MRTRIEVGPDHCDLSHGLLQARRLRSTPGELRVALVAGQALLLDGDHVEVEVVVTGLARLRVVEPAGTVAYDMRGGSARWDVAVTLRDGAHLVWDAEPFVVARGASVRRTTVLDVGAGCTAQLRETLVLGRHGEPGGALRTTTRAALAGRPALAEDLSLTPEDRTGWAVLGEHRVLDSLTTLGTRLPEDPLTLQLDTEGSVYRWIGSATHLSPLARGAAPMD